MALEHLWATLWKYRRLQGQVEILAFHILALILLYTHTYWHLRQPLYLAFLSNPRNYLLILGNYLLNMGNYLLIYGKLFANFGKLFANFGKLFANYGKLFANLWETIC